MADGLEQLGKRQLVKLVLHLREDNVKLLDENKNKLDTREWELASASPPGSIYVHGIKGSDRLRDMILPPQQNLWMISGSGRWPSWWYRAVFIVLKRR